MDNVLQYYMLKAVVNASVVLAEKRSAFSPYIKSIQVTTSTIYLL